MALVKCATCGEEYNTRDIGRGLFAIEEAHPTKSDDPDCPVPCYGIGHKDRIVCPVFTCRGKLEPVNAPNER